jgi:predicted AAA+ superfamily ATPase
MTSPVERNLEKPLREGATHYPVVTVTGPRQSGKTTLCQMAFPHLPYVTLEPLDTRDYARRDPRGFLAEHDAGAILDEVQHVPELLPYLQEEVDRSPDRKGRFILTGSQHLGLLQGITQSLAGRTAVLFLLPPSLDELRRFAHGPRSTEDLFTCLFTGAYPRIHDQGIPPERWLADYVTTYVQRDVRQVLQVGDLHAFTTFVRLCAGRTAQELNLSTLGADAGVSHNTSRAWLSVLETGFLLFRLPAWHPNLRKQLVKTPKLHFIDSGLLCHLLGIREPEQLRHHPLRGAIFESWAVSEVHKAWLNRGLQPRLQHFRESRGLEVDLIVDRPDLLTLVEIKSAETVAPDFFTSLEKLATLLAPRERRPIQQHLIYGGARSQRRGSGSVIPWREVDDHSWTGMS